MNGRETHPKLASLQTRGLIVGVIGVVACAIGMMADADQFYRSFLTSYLFWFAISVGCLGWTMIYHLTTGSWGVPSRRIWEAGARTIPLMAVMVIPILMGLDSLFPWARSEAANDAMIQGKSLYLNVPFFIARAVFFGVLWSTFAYLLSRWSKKQDEEGPIPYTTRMRWLSGPALFIMALTLTFFSVDYVMSIDPHWFSTIFGFLFVASDLLAGMAFTILIVKLLEHNKELAKVVTKGTFHDLGNLLMAFVMLWAYMSFSQFLIIWSGNTQEEAPWYVDRMGQGWIVISVILIVFHFALPFLILLTRRTKRASSILVKIAAYMLVMRFIDLYWLTQPSFTHGGGVHPHWLDLATMAAVGGLWLGFFGWQLKDKPLLAVNDPRLPEVLEAAGGHH